VECPNGTLGYVLVWLDISTDVTSPDWDRRVAILEIVVSRDHQRIPPGALGLCPENELRIVPDPN
jgi:hypothetical protein